jgi:hypothetical protein
MGFHVIANELKGKNIPVGILHPGFVETNMTKSF